MIWEADKGSKIEVAERYGIPLSIQMNNELYWGADVPSLMGMHDDVKNKMCEWFCSIAEVNSIAVVGCSAQEKADEIILKMAIKFKC
jgi:hypothetical protein